MSYENCTTVSYRLRHNAAATGQCLQVRLGHLTHLTSRSPHVGLPCEILEEGSYSTVADALFPLPLLELQDPCLCNTHIVQLLSLFNLGYVTCRLFAEKITSFAVQLAAGNYQTKFHIVADIHYIQMFWLEPADPVPAVWTDRGGRGLGGVVMEETVILDEAPAIMNDAPSRRAAPTTAVERLKKGKFDGIERGEELGDCSVCYEELKNEVCRIPCGHVYHKSCILTWAQMSNSCPLCRRKLEE